MCVVCYAARDWLWVKRRIETCRSNFKSFNTNNFMCVHCLVYCTNQVTLRNARCNDKDKDKDFIQYYFILYSVENHMLQLNN